MTWTAQSHETPTASVASSTITGWPLNWTDGFSAPTGAISWRIRSAQRPSITRSAGATLRADGGPPLFNQPDTVAGW